MQYGTKGNPNADILIVGEAWGRQEAEQHQPFVGASGQELERILKEAGIDPHQCFYTNVVNAHPNNNRITEFFIKTKDARAMGMEPIRGLYPDISILDGIDRLEEVISKVKPKVIVAFGNYALWALTETDFRVTDGKFESVGHKVPTGITSYRGSQLRSRFGDIPLLPTYHPAAVLRNWPWRYQVVHDLKARIPLALADNWDEPERNYYLAPSLETVMKVLSDLLARAELSPIPILATCDIETLGSHTECVGIGWSRRDAICIPIMCNSRWEGYWDTWEEVEVVKMLAKVLTHPNIDWCGQNFFYDIQYFFTYWGIFPTYKQDTMLAHHVCFPGTLMGLDYLSSLYCAYHRYWKEDGKVATRNQDDLERWKYNARDCVVTFEVIEEVWKVIEHYGLEVNYAVQMMRANEILTPMLRGVKLDEGRRYEEKKVHGLEKQRLERWLNEVMPKSCRSSIKSKTPWFNSPKQLQEILYDNIGLTPITDYKTGNPTTDDEALTILGRRYPLLSPVMETLQQYRSLTAFDQFLSMNTGWDGRMRTTYSPTTETFRYRSGKDAFGSGRNMQNLPKGAEND